MAFLMTTIKPEQADSNCINEIWTKKELCSMFMFNFISPIQLPFYQSAFRFDVCAFFVHFFFCIDPLLYIITIYQR